MIPIVLTSTAAQPDMGIQVWMLGQSRAIPRNYYHTVINDAAIDWATGGANYNDLIIRATKEAEGRHTFVTEYAGTSSILQGVLDPAGRFGDQTSLAAQKTPVAFVDYLLQNGFTTSTSLSGGVSPTSSGFSGALLAILEANIPFPSGLAAVAPGITPGTFYQQLDYFLSTDFVNQHPTVFVGLNYTIDAKAMADDIWKRVVGPTLAAAKLFEAPYLTRLYTTLSPEQMNRDPVFSYNPDLAAVSNVHDATASQNCSLTGNLQSTEVHTEQGFRIRTGGTSTPQPATAVPASLRIEVLRESGAAMVSQGNAAAIAAQTGLGGRFSSSSGCRLVAPPAARGQLAVLALLALLAAALRRRATGAA